MRARLQGFAVWSLACALCAAHATGPASAQGGAREREGAAATAPAAGPERGRTDGEANPPAAPADGQSGSAAPHDLSITARVTAESLVFRKVPDPKVEFTGRPRRETVWESDRKNLPEQVRPGETYRDIGITLRITSVFADIDRIVAEALGEIPSDATPPQPGPAPAAPPSPAEPATPAGPPSHSSPPAATPAPKPTATRRTNGDAPARRRASARRGRRP
jgi:hypothetical protein